MKKVLTTLVLSIILTGGCLASSPIVVSSPDQEAMTVVAEGPDGSAQEEGDWVNSTETNTVTVSETARKIEQAQRAENLKVQDKYGGAVTIIAMVIVILALTVLCILFLGFGKISKSFHKKKKSKARGLDIEELDDDHVDSGEVIAAISAALAQHFSGVHDIERTILTLRRMKRSYSPWNSKIYNMRVMQGVKHNTPQR